ncbi:hypothetical protein GJV85_00030 [Sulfurimonas aquatica]|uniref:Uncharacterized protein n=1 Tax=Sulfurimonas aquatica TaxID=2672570 RepID=A0A975GBU0_9BACT|nr:hypothetical protein [Sulfurimonas aquatica]QSZ40569.1 hypothetical protein GJV85_00030 [Sulfurimonas aquatica]
MFGKILSKKKKEEANPVREKVSKMTITEMKSYVRAPDVEEEDIYEVMRKLTLEDKSTKQLYIKSDDMDSKKKKAFDLVLQISGNAKVSVDSIELTQKFLEVYADILKDYDTKHKDIYISRITDSIDVSLGILETLTQLKSKMDLLKQ